LFPQIFVTVPVVKLPPEIVMVGVLPSVSCDWKSTVIVSPTLAYQVFVALLELNVVVPVSIGVSLSILICTEDFVASVFHKSSIE